MARELLAKARRLALVIQNALLNADLQRACSVLQDLEIATSIDVCADGSLLYAARWSPGILATCGVGATRARRSDVG